MRYLYYMQTINTYEVAARTKKVNRLLATIESLPTGLRDDLTDIISAEDATAEVWESLARLSGTHPAGEGTKRTLAILLGTGQA